MHAHSSPERTAVMTESASKAGPDHPVSGLWLGEQNAPQIDEQVGADTEGGGKIYPLTDQCHHYTRRKDVEYDVQK